MSNTLNTPVEALETAYPLRVERYALRAGSGGDGRHPGGDGVIRSITVLEPCEASILSDRRRHAPHGAKGGKPGKPGSNRLNGRDARPQGAAEARAGRHDHDLDARRRRLREAAMRIAVAADEDTGVAGAVVEQLRARGHEPLLHGALNPGERDDWAWASEAAARDVADGRADQGVVCCWTGTGASIAANKVAGIRAALCGDAETAAGARRWNDANVLALSLRTTSEAVLGEILDAWFAAEPSPDDDDRANVRHLDEI